MTFSNPRGQVLCEYIDDSGRPWLRRVNAAYVAMAERGWTAATGLPAEPFPRGWLERKVVGVDSTGRTQRAVVGRLDATLWSGTVTRFTVEASDGSFQDCQVVARLAERRPLERT